MPNKINKLSDKIYVLKTPGREIFLSSKLVGAVLDNVMRKANFENQ